MAPIVTSWAVNQDALDQAFQLTATDDGGATATAIFTDSITNPVDVTGQNSWAVANGAVFTNTTSAVSTGTGLFDTFLVIQKNGTEQGFDHGSPLPLDDKEVPPYQALLLAAIPIVVGDGTSGTTSGVSYREFRLDINQSGKANEPQLISLDQLKIYQGGTGDLLSLPGTPIYDLDAGLNRPLCWMHNGTRAAARAIMFYRFLTAFSISREPTPTSICIRRSAAARAARMRPNTLRTAASRNGVLGAINPGINIGQNNR